MIYKWFLGPTCRVPAISVPIKPGVWAAQELPPSMEPDGIAGHALVPSNGPAHERAWQHHVGVFVEIGDGWQVVCINRYIYIYI